MKVVCDNDEEGMILDPRLVKMRNAIIHGDVALLKTMLADENYADLLDLNRERLRDEGALCLESGALDPDCEPLLNVAVDQQNPEILSLCLQHGKWTKYWQGCLDGALREAIELLNADIVQMLLQAGANPKSHHLLQLVSGHYISNLPLMCLLIQSGADLDMADESGITPLMSACIAGHITEVKLLVEAGADITKIDSIGWRTAVYLAKSRGHAAIVDYLQSVLANS